MEIEELSGTVERLVFHNTETGFAIFILAIKKNHTATVKGVIPALHEGEHVQVRGSWITHPKFGKQFEAQQCTVQVPTSILGLKKYLASGLIKGIGPTYAEKLVAAFGAQVLDVIDTQPERLHGVAGFGPKRVQSIIDAWQNQKEISKIMVFLQDKGVSTAYATKIYKTYGGNSIERVIENPYRLAEDIWGIGFKTADRIAQHMGFEKESLKRINAGLQFAMNSIINDGHLYSEVNELKQKTIELLELESEAVADKLKMALHSLYDQEKIKLITYQNIHYVTLSKFYFSEKGVAQKIKTLTSYASRFEFDINAMYHALRTSNDSVELHELQQQGILTCLQNKITIITGGPGTGKTTLIKKLLTVLDMNKLRYKLASPTGRAAKRITEGTGKPAVTLHRLLEIDPATMSFSRNEQNALDLDYLIIDEASMIDIFLAHSVLRALPLNAHLVLIGDIDQLPSVGAGNFLRDLITSNAIPCIRLTQIFRQAQDSMIIMNAHRVNKGEFPLSAQEGTRKDFIFIKEELPEQVPQHLENIFTNGLKKFGIPIQDALVLVPMNRGTVGTQKINHDLQSLLNPGNNDKLLSFASTQYKIGDRVMQLRNNYDKLVFNGDIGTIEDIDVQERTLTVNYGDRSTLYESSELDELTLAYAISIHKSQGSEYAAVIVPLFMQHFMLLQRNLLYTAITRAKKLCIFIGQTKAIAMAIKNNKEQKRVTFLPHYLTTDLACR
jgi:exodeoxyribonuclease V alpha subunit